MTIASTSIQTQTLAVGSLVQRKGYFTKLLSLGDLADEKELERRVGYGPGLLRLGWYVLLMVENTPGPNDFELGGHTHFSGSRIRGHTNDPKEHVEDSLRAQGIDVMRSRAISAQRFTTTGPERLAKITPVISTGTYWNPDPNPIPQWKLINPMTFLVSAFHPGSASLKS